MGAGRDLACARQVGNGIWLCRGPPGRVRKEVLFTEESSVLKSLESLLLTSSGMFLDALASFETMFKIKLAMFSRLIDFKSSRLLQSITKYYRVLQGITEYYSVLKSITEYYRVLQSIIEYYRVLQSTTEYYKVLESITEYNKVLQSITEHYRA